MSVVKAKKHLGQHFLVDKNIARKIVNALDSQNQLTVVEIGPGMGVLTDFLLEKDLSKLILIEIDNESVEYLNNKYNTPKMSILNEDFLKMNLNKIGDSFSIIGNFPYNISSQIFFKILESRDSVHQTVCMIQKEVADRIKSPPGNKTYGILSVLLQAFYEIDYLFTVNEKVFNPPPKVKSAVISLQRNNKQQLDCNEKLFFELVKASFNQRRKTLRNSLKRFLKPDIENDSIFQKRPEQLSVDDFIYLTRLIDQN